MTPTKPAREVPACPHHPQYQPATYEPGSRRTIGPVVGDRSCLDCWKARAQHIYRTFQVGIERELELEKRIQTLEAELTEVKEQLAEEEAKIKLSNIATGLLKSELEQAKAREQKLVEALDKAEKRITYLDGQRSDFAIELEILRKKHKDLRFALYCSQCHGTGKVQSIGLNWADCPNCAKARAALEAQ